MPPQQQFSMPRPTRVVVRLLIAIGAIWLLSAIFRNLAESGFVDTLYAYLHLRPTEVVPGAYVWQIATYSWLHDLNSLGHVLFNCLTLFFLGPTLERRWGGANFFRFYLLAGVIAGIVSVLIGIAFGGRWDASIVGASGAIFGMLAAYSMLYPNMTIMVMFVIPVRARWLIWIAIGIDILMFIANPNGNVAIQTHLGGAFGGWLLVTGNWRPRIFLPKIKRLFSGGRRPPPRSNLHVIKGGKYLN